MPGGGDEAAVPAARAWAEAVAAWVNVGVRLLIAGALAVAVFAPDLVPLLKRFGVRSSEINILGSKVQIVDLALSGDAVKITDDGHMLIGGLDANTIPDRLAQLEQTGRDLKAENDKLKAALTELQAAAQVAKKQLEEANQRLPSSPTAIIRTEDLAEVISKSAAQVASASALAAQATAVIATPDVAPAVGFGVVIGADASPEAAMDEVRKAQKATANPFILFKRQGYWRSVAFFGTQAAASAALPALKAGSPQAYVVDISRWCPTPVRVAPASDKLAEQKDCGF